MRHVHTGARLLAVSALVLAITLVALSDRAARAEIANGGFEAGTFIGWQVANQPGGSGSWLVTSGPATFATHQPMPAPPEGAYAAVSDMVGGGSHLLYQDIVVPSCSGASVLLSFFVYYTNRANAFISPPTLDFLVGPNQQYRVDLLRPGAAVDSVDSGDVLVPLFQTTARSPLALEPTRVTADITSLGGQVVRLRFAEVDNLGQLNAAVDAVQVQLAMAPRGGCTPTATATLTATPSATPTVDPITTPTSTPTPCPRGGCDAATATATPTTTATPTATPTVVPTVPLTTTPTPCPRGGCVAATATASPLSGW